MQCINKQSPQLVHSSPIYLDCNATTPIEPRVQEEVIRFLSQEFGNAGSRTHEFGVRAKQAVQKAREQIATVVKARRDEVIFTSGATESNNLAILGLAEEGERSDRKHIISTEIEHKAVLEPLEWLSKRGFKITLLKPNPGGWIDTEKVMSSLRKETLLVTVMHVNNETGVFQPISEIADALKDHPAYFHVDAAQGFGKEIESLQHCRIDLISVSAHKIYGPKGAGALIARRRGYDRIPLAPLMAGGGQEFGLRPGTLPTELIVGLGKAAELALAESSPRAAKCMGFKTRALQALAPLKPVFNGDQTRTLPHVFNISFQGLDSEAVMVALKDWVAISNGSACTSTSYELSHVLKAMELPEKRIKGALRFSWCHMSSDPDWSEIIKQIKRLS